MMAKNYDEFKPFTCETAFLQCGFLVRSRRYNLCTHQYTLYSSANILHLYYVIYISGVVVIHLLGNFWCCYMSAEFLTNEMVILQFGNLNEYTKN